MRVNSLGSFTLLTFDNSVSFAVYFYRLLKPIIEKFVSSLLKKMLEAARVAENDA